MELFSIRIQRTFQLVSTNLEKPVVENCVKHDYMNNYEMRAAEIEREKAERQADIKRVIHEYTTFVMTEFLSKEDLEILHENIEYFRTDSLIYTSQSVQK